MYESFFGLREKPFSLLPDPGFLFFSKIHQEALTLIEYGLLSQSGFTILSGEIGAGKTTLMRYLLGRLDEQVTVGLVSQTHQSLGDLIDWICIAFDLKAGDGDKLEKHRLFVDFLIEQYAQGKRTLLIIDEAQNLGIDKLEELRLLSNINADRDFVLQLMLLGQHQLRDQLRTPQLEQFVQRVSASYHLGRLNSEETYQYIRHRIKVAGGETDIFTSDACHAVYHYSKGTPRIINLICDTALVYAYGGNEKIIYGESIDELVETHASNLLISFEGEERVKPDGPKPFSSDQPGGAERSQTPIIRTSDSLRYAHASLSVQTQTATLLIIASETSEAERVISVLRDDGFTARSVTVPHAERLDDVIAKRGCDMILCCSHDRNIDLDAVLVAYRKLDGDVPLLLIANPENAANDLVKAREVGVRDLIRRSDNEQLKLAVTREFADLLRRRDARGLSERHQLCERRSRELIEVTGVGVAFIQDGLHIDANPAYLALFGYDSLDDLQDTTFLDLVSPEQQKLLRDVLRSGEAANSPLELKLTCRRADGTEFRALLVAASAEIDNEPCLRLILQDLDGTHAAGQAKIGCSSIF